MVNDRLKRYLDQERAAYETLPQREVFTAREVAAESPSMASDHQTRCLPQRCVRVDGEGVAGHHVSNLHRSLSFTSA